jgi:hypothetical protein
MKWIQQVHATHYQRQFMQYLEGRGWVKASKLPDSPRTAKTLLARGWIERKLSSVDGLHYRITEKGIAAKRAPIP